jgi:hypothetical protein
MHKKRVFRYAVAAALGLGAVAGSLAIILRPHNVGAARTSTTLASTARLDPAHLAALHTDRTAVAGVPELTRMIGPGATPAPGAAHRLGPDGMTLAWANQGAICEVQASSGGCVPPTDRPIEVTIADPDAVGKGQPERVMGLAADGVASVVVTLADGRKFDAAPVDNFYAIPLPDDVTPGVGMSVVATMADGSTYSEQRPSAPPPTATGPNSSP